LRASPIFVVANGKNRAVIGDGIGEASKEGFNKSKLKMVG